MNSMRFLISMALLLAVCVGACSKDEQGHAKAPRKPSTDGISEITENITVTTTNASHADKGDSQDTAPGLSSIQEKGLQSIAVLISMRADTIRKLGEVNQQLRRLAQEKGGQTATKIADAIETGRKKRSSITREELQESINHVEALLGRSTNSIALPLIVDNESKVDSSMPAFDSSGGQKIRALLNFIQNNLKIANEQNQVTNGWLILYNWVEGFIEWPNSESIKNAHFVAKLVQDGDRFCVEELLLEAEEIRVVTGDCARAGEVDRLNEQGQLPQLGGTPTQTGRTVPKTANAHEIGSAIPERLSPIQMDAMADVALLIGVRCIGMEVSELARSALGQNDHVSKNLREGKNAKAEASMREMRAFQNQVIENPLVHNFESVLGQSGDTARKMIGRKERLPDLTMPALDRTKKIEALATAVGDRLKSPSTAIWRKEEWIVAYNWIEGIVEAKTGFGGFERCHFVGRLSRGTNGYKVEELFIE